MSTGRVVAVAAIIFIHVGVFYVMEKGLSRAAMQLITGPLKADILEEEMPPPEEPPPPPPKLETPPPFVPLPDFDISMPAEATTAITQTTNVVPPVAPPPMAVQQVVRTPPRSPPGKTLSRPDYPPTERRLNHEGTVTLMIYVLEDGRVGDVKIEKSSGFPRLDEAAASHAKREWRFIPGKENDKAIATWGRFQVTFKLTED
jgi:protein TonB